MPVMSVLSVFIERELEQNSLDFVLGNSSSYMESDIRDQTDEAGFCRVHMKKMFDYGNTLGNALILQTHYHKLREEMRKQFDSFHPENPRSSRVSAFQIPAQIRIRLLHGLLLRIAAVLSVRILRIHLNGIWNFFWLYRQDNEFKNKILRSKGFCLHHFGILCNGADKYLNDKEKAEFYPAMFRLMDENFQRMEEDLVWLSDKFDYRNKDADWKNSKDALQRGMQKLRSGYPADPVT